MYQFIQESEVMKLLASAILKQAAADMKSKSELQRMDAEYFIKSEFCELVCCVAHVECEVLRQVVKVRKSL